MTSNQFDPSTFTTATPKPLPIILLLDVSGSMRDVVDEKFERTGQIVFIDGQQRELVIGGESRISILNKSVKTMIDAFAKEEGADHTYLLSIITFGSTVDLHLSPTPASKVVWEDMQADGLTPLGQALGKAKELIEDKEVTPSRAYRPIVVLVSDGNPDPDDPWREKLRDFVSTGRSAKCDRMAMAIGAKANEAMLVEFLGDSQHQLFFADDAEKISSFFRYVTMSASIRMASKNPNAIRHVPGKASEVLPSGPSSAAYYDDEDADTCR